MSIDTLSTSSTENESDIDQSPSVEERAQAEEAHREMGRRAVFEVPQTDDDESHIFRGLE